MPFKTRAMGYCGLKISGHSETEFKNRTAFKTRKKVVDIENSSNTAVNSTRNYKYDYKKEFRLKLLSLFIVTIGIALLYMGGKTIFRTGLDPHLAALKSPKKDTESENIHAAYVMYQSANAYYNSGALNHAQDEMVRVLKLYPTNQDALLLMSKILTKQCEVKNQFCKEASEYKTFLKL